MSIPGLPRPAESRKSIPYGRQEISTTDIEAVVEVLRSDFLTQGPAVPIFESAVAAYAGARHGVAVCNATAALHLACAALGLTAGDYLWTSPNTFVASANCGRYCQATVDFVDIDPNTYNMSVAALQRKLERAKDTGTLPKVVVPVDFAGQPCDLQEVRELATRYGFKIIQDASHAIGSEYLGQKTGGCKYSDITVFSFHPVKIITTGEGGMALTNDADVHRRMSMLRTHGIVRDDASMLGASEGGWYYQQLELGFNYRMTDFQAALGYSQLSRIDQFVHRRAYLAARYSKAFRSLPLITPEQSQHRTSAWHLYVIRLDRDRISVTRRQVYDALRAKGILVNVHYIPVHLQPYYRQRGFSRGDFPVAEAYYDSAISLPMYSGLSDEDQDRVIAAVADVVGHAHR